MSKNEPKQASVEDLEKQITELQAEIETLKNDAVANAALLEEFKKAASLKIAERNEARMNRSERPKGELVKNATVRAVRKSYVNDRLLEIGDVVLGYTGALGDNLEIFKPEQ